MACCLSGLYSDIILSCMYFPLYRCSEPITVDVSPYRRRSSPCHPGDRSQLRQGLARSQSDMFPPVTLTPGLLGTPARVNPFSLRQDLNGGRCKLLDTPSKSVISLTFTLPTHQCASPNLLRGTPGTRALPRRCQSLPCTPEMSRTVGFPNDTELKEEKKDDDVQETGIKAKDVDYGLKEITWMSEATEERLHVHHIDTTEKLELLNKKEVGTEEDSGLPIELEMVSLERLDEEEEEDGEDEESACLTEPMDCSKSPEPSERVLNSTPVVPLLTSTSTSSVRTNGWQLPISNGPPSLPPLPRLDNNNGSSIVIGQQVQWGREWTSNGHSEAQVLSSQTSGSFEQDDVISCPGCCLVGLSFPSVCLRGSAAVPTPRRRASLPRQRPYRNLNGPITSSSTSSSETASTAAKTLLCRSPNGLVVAGPPVLREPGRCLPGAQS